MIDLESVVLSSLARLSRNLPEYKFTSKCDLKERQEISTSIKQKIDDVLVSRGYRFFMMRGLSRSRRGMLKENNLISRDMNKKISGKGVILRDNFSGPLSVMVNDGDHIRIQSLRKGFDLDDPYNRVIDLEKSFEGPLVFAFDKKLGYLTASPTNVGTGLRLSMMVHIPGLIMSSRIADFIKRINNIGFGLKGCFGEESEVIGNIFQIYSQKTIGISEEELLMETKAVAINIFEEEKRSIEGLLKESPKILEDNIYRSYGMVKYAKLLNFEEAIELVSMIKLGKDIGLLENIKSFDHYQLILDLGRNHIVDKIIDEDDIDDESIEIFRADYLKEKLLKKDLI